MTACGAESLDTGEQRSGDDVGASAGASSGPDGGTPPGGVAWQPWELEGPPPYWARRFSSASGLGADLIQAAPVGLEFTQGVIAGGNSVDGGWLMALDDRGETLWSKIYPGLTIAALGRRAGEGYWTVGSRNTGGNNVLVLAGIDAQGEVLWNRSYARADSNIRPQDARAPTDGDRDAGFVVAGLIGYDWADGWLARFDAAGELLWEHFYTPSFALAAVRAVDDGGFIAVGALHDEDACYGQRVSATGELMWARRWAVGHSCPQVQLFSKEGKGAADSMVAVGSGFVSMISLDGELHWQLAASSGSYGTLLGEPIVVAGANGISIGAGIEKSTSSDFWWIELDHSGKPKNSQLFTRTGHESVQTLIRLTDGWLAAGPCRRRLSLSWNTRSFRSPKNSAIQAPHSCV